MRRIWRCPARLGWSLSLALVIVMMSSRGADAQYLGYGAGYEYPGWGYGSPGVGFGYPGLGYGYSGVGYAYPAFGYGYPAFGSGLGPRLAYPGPVWSVGYPGFYGSGYGNPLFGAGLTPLGVQSYWVETRLLGRVPRTSGRSGGYGSLP